MSITPQSDGILENLLIYLKEYLNNQAIAYYTDISQPIQTAVTGIEAVQSDLNAVAKYPLLMGYRRSFSGPEFEITDARLDYFLLVNVNSRLNQNAMFTWVVKHLAIALNDYNEIDEGCLKILEVGSANILHAQVRGKNGPLTIPFLRVDFRFQDLVLPI